MKSNRTPNILWFHHWIKIQRKYRNTQAKWLESHDIRIARKLDILKRKIHGLNRKWRLGFASAVLTTWLTAFPSAQVEAQSFPQDLDLSALDGSDGFAMSGLDPYDRLGTSVSNAGDVNGDGIDDFIIGSRNAFVYGIGPNVGRAYVVFGGVGLTDPNFDLSSLDGTNGFVINGTAYGDYLGSAVSGAGDVNGDGVDDLIIGAPGVDTSYDNGSEVYNYTNAGAIYVIFGKPSGSTFSASLDLSTLDGSNGFEVYSTYSNGGAGTSVSGAGDINGDGVDDLLIGAPGVNGFDAETGPIIYAGAAYVVFGKLSGSSFPASLDLSGLDGSNGFVIIGGNEYGYAATSVSDAGDVNGDGIDDLLIGAPGTNDYYDNSGAAYVVFGKTEAFASSLDLDGLDGTNGFVINGYYQNQYLGTSVSGAGDINGDGIDDLIIGSSYDGSFSRGVSYVIFGQMDEFPASIDAYDVNGTNGFAIVGNQRDLAGSAVSGVGDVNGDGIDDLLIGAPGADSYDYNNVGASYVVFGKTSSFSNYMNVNDLDGYVNGFVINGSYENESSGFSVSGAGDINGDGVIDLLIGAPGLLSNEGPGGESGTAYVVFGIVVPIVPVLINAITDQKAKEDQSFSFEIPDNTFANVETLSATLSGGGALPEWLSFEPTTSTFSGTPANGDVGTLSIEVTGTDSESNTATDTFDLIVQDAQSFPSTVDLSSLDGSDGFVMKGIDATDVSGYEVSGVGDINGDGFDDVLIGAKLADPNGNNYAGEVYIVFGKADGFTSSIGLSDLDGTNGFLIEGLDAGDRIGARKSGAGDVNGDGINDLLIGSYTADANSNAGAGETYVIFGKSTAFAASFDLSGLNGSNGFIIDGVAAGDASGTEVASADINGDNVDDILIGASNASANSNDNSGVTYVVFGKTASFAANLDLSSLDGTNGFAINGIDADDYSGTSVSNAGDVNGDGVEDILIGSYSASQNGNGNTGEIYVVFGKTGSFGPSMNLSSLDGNNGFIIRGIDGGDYSGLSVSSAGDMNGDDVDDILIGGFGADIDGKSLVGETYVVFGKTTAFAASFDLSALDGTNGFTINGINDGDWSGRSVSEAGDVNLDGYDDILIGAPEVDRGDDSGVGEAYVVFGKGDAFTSSLDLSSLDGTNGFVIKGIDSGDKLGFSIDQAGDMNGDGVPDLLLGAYGARNESYQSQVGETYVLFGVLPASAPTLANAIEDQTATEDAEFSFVVPANTFEDLNENDEQTLSATLDGGDPLPDWITFNGATATFSGIPANEDVGIISVEVTSTDEDDLSTSDVFELEVTNTNDEPTLAAIGNQIGDENADITFTASAEDIDPTEDNLTFSLDATAESKGMSINETTGEFSWTPDEEQDGDHEVTVTVTDEGELFDEETFTITVNETNQEPVLETIGAQSGDEGTEITFIASAVDPDLPANNLSYFIDINSFEKGMSINETTGEFSWTPEEDQNGDHDVTVTVSDGELSDEETVTISINEVNEDPVLETIGAQSGDEGIEITFIASAVDPDLPANNLSYFIDINSFEKGMSINETTGEFSWIPEEDQDGDHEVTVTVTDEGELFDEETFTITVNEANQEPVLDAIGNQEGDEETAITFTATATDSDLPANDLSYFIDISSSEKGMIIDEVTGVFSWTPTPIHVGDHVVTVTVTDGDLEDDETITITVNSVVNTWNGENWSGGEAPLPNENARLSGDYQSEFYGSLEVNNLEIDPEVTLTMDGAFTLKINGDLTNGGDIIIESGSSLITYEANTITGNDIIFVRNTRYEDGKYSFVGTPIELNMSTTGASLGTSVYRYEEFQPYSDNEGLNRWAPAEDDVLLPGTGYTQAFQKELIFVGKPNDGTVTYPGTYTEDTDDANEGWNLVSNPYPAAIFIDEFLDENLNIDGAVYIWDDNGSETTRGSNNDYIVANEMAATDNNGADNEIRYNFHLGSSQGFFVKLLSDIDTDVVFTEGMRETGNNSDGNFFRKTSVNIPLVRLNLTDADGLFKQTIIGWPSDAVDDKMQRAYDAPVFNASSANSLYTHKLGKKLAIQGVSDERVTIDLGFSVDRKADYQLFVDFEQASDVSLWIHDQLIDEIIDLQKGAYHFSSEAGDFLNRFVILTENIGVLASGNLDQEGSNVYAFDNVLYINPSSLDLEGGVSRTYTVFNLSGKFMMKTELNQRSQIALNAFIPGVYLVSDGAAITKIIIE